MIEIDKLTESPKYDKLKWIVPEDARIEWNQKYKLDFPEGITFLDVLIMLYSNTLPQQKTTN